MRDVAIVSREFLRERSRWRYTRNLIWTDRCRRNEGRLRNEGVFDASICAFERARNVSQERSSSRCQADVDDEVRGIKRSASAVGARGRQRAGPLILVLLLALWHVNPIASERSPSLTVVELFTSQGCSSCPPANANAIVLSERQGILVLSYGVTYWDHLGWRDIFAKPEFTRRQVDYETTLGRSGPFTPQIVVDGRRDTVGDVRSDIEKLLSARKDAATIEFAGETVRIGAGTLGYRSVDVWLVTYDPRTIEVPVSRGENGGRTLPHKNTVRSLIRLGGWEGRPVSFELPPSEPSLRAAILLQVSAGGPILAAAIR